MPRTQNYRQALRHHFGLKSRRPKQRPDSLPVVQRLFSGEEIHRNIPIEEYPVSFAIVLPNFPKFMPKVRRHIEALIDRRILQVCPYGANNLASQLNNISKEYGVATTVCATSAGFHEFRRLLAKIAYSYTVGVVGLDNFTPTLVDFILGTDKIAAAEFIGCTRIAVPKSANLHEVSIGTLLSFSPKRPIVVRIALFSCFGICVFRVLTGWLKPGVVAPSSTYNLPTPQPILDKLHSFGTEEDAKGLWVAVQDQAFTQGRKEPPLGFPPQ